MIVTKIGFPSILKDNDMFYIGHILGHIDRIDSGCIITMVKGLNKIVFDIMPSDFFRKKTLIAEIVRIHRLLGMEPEFSKTLEYSPSIYFSLNSLDN